MKVLFRTDGNETIGLGHIVRCTALAEMIAPEFQSVFILKTSTSTAIQMIEKENLTYHKIEDESDFFNMLSDGCIVVTDNYDFDGAYFEKIIQTGAKLVCIDDMVNTYYPAHLIINQNPAYIPNDYNAAPYTQFAIGLTYALLRKPFREAMQQQKKAAKNGKYLVAMGGTDPLDLSKPIIDSLRLVVPDEKISLLINEKKYPTYQELFPQIKQYHSLDATSLCQLMLEHQYLICPASSVSIEGLSLGMELICGYYADNQKAFYQYYFQNKLIKEVGNFNSTHLNLANLILDNQEKINTWNPEYPCTPFSSQFKKLLHHA
jgi:UDP-2,4-diacetamido-2,4,6-trideoxy-beta-L-altropyranose hydrolase